MLVIAVLIYSIIGVFGSSCSKKNNYSKYLNNKTNYSSSRSQSSAYGKYSSSKSSSSSYSYYGKSTNRKDSRSNAKSDPYDAKNYYDAQDFYDDHEDDFWDEDDAESYFDEQNG